MQFKFKYIDKVPDDIRGAPALYGSCVHLVLEMINSGQIAPKKAVKTFEQMWGEPEKYGMEPVETYPPRTSWKSYLKRGKESIAKYVESISWRDRQVIATEHKFLVKLGDHELTGFVDHIEMTQDKKGNWVLMISDHKTAAKNPNATSLRYNVQISIYDLASRQKEFWIGNGPDYPGIEDGERWWELTKDLPRLNIWHAVSNGKEINAGERTQEDFERLHLALDQITKQVEADVYALDISGESCHFCPYKKECKLPIKDEDPEW